MRDDTAMKESAPTASDRTTLAAMVRNRGRWRQWITLPAKALRRLCTEGWAALTARGWRRLVDGAREASLRVETGGSIESKWFSDNPDHFGYQPISYGCCIKALDRAAVADQDVFLDFGCGKGRAVVLAAQRPFRTVWGVELCGELARAAGENVRRAGKRLRCQDVRIVNQDATQFRIPRDVNVVFLYNPFAGDVLRRVLGNLSQSLHEHPRKLTVIYALPRMDRDLLAETPWLTEVEEIPTANSAWQRITIYRYAPERRHADPGRPHVEDSVLNAASQHPRMLS